MKRFLLFAGPDYYPRGGWLDFRGSFDTEQDARNAIPDTFSKLRDSDGDGWWDIVDTQTGQAITSNAERWAWEEDSDECSMPELHGHPTDPTAQQKWRTLIGAYHPDNLNKLAATDGGVIKCYRVDLNDF